MTATRQGGTAPGAGRGLIITIVAVALGLYVLAGAFDGSSASDEVADPEDGTAADNEDGDEESSDADGTGSDGEEPEPAITTSTAPPPPSTHRPGEVKVAAVNGTGRTGLAGATGDILAARGYVAAAKNAAATPVQTSAIYYQPDYSEDAKAVASALNAPAEILLPAPSNMLTLVANPETVIDFHVFVVLGVDSVIPITVE